MKAPGSVSPLAEGHLLWRETATVTYLEPVALSASPALRCAFTTRHAGRSGQSLKTGEYLLLTPPACYTQSNVCSLKEE